MTPREKILNNAIDYSLQEDNYLEWEDYVGDYNDDKEYIGKAYKSGAEYGYNLAIENVVNWLCMNMTDTLYLGALTKMTMSKPELINNLKQAMKL